MQPARTHRHFNFRRANHLLLTAIILINGYVIGAPLAPAVSYWWSEHVGHTSHKLQTTLSTPVKSKSSTPVVIPQDNRLIVPSMQLDTTIYDGPDLSTLNKGLWHRPNTSSPDKGGNTVIAGHRFTYTNPKGILYYLDKVQVGDQIGVWWQKKRYVYKVTQVRVVPPTEVSVEDNTTDSRLTLYTCTPLWSPKQRLVVIASLESSS